MATTTTNFGFDIPQSSDLVKNGATAIAELGQDIDTKFAGLTVNAQTGTTYTAVKADGLNSVVTMDNASANTFYIPTDAITILSYSALPLLAFGVRLSLPALTGVVLVVVGACLVKWG